MRNTSVCFLIFNLLISISGCERDDPAQGMSGSTEGFFENVGDSVHDIDHDYSARENIGDGVERSHENREYDLADVTDD
jgi:hypothetical protein